MNDTGLPLVGLGEVLTGLSSFDAQSRKFEPHEPLVFVENNVVIDFPVFWDES